MPMSLLDFNTKVGKMFSMLVASFAKSFIDLSGGFTNNLVLPNVVTSLSGGLR